MSRKDGMQLVQRVSAEREQRQAARLAASRGRLSQAEARLAELQGYHDSYRDALGGRLAQGMNIAGLRDYQAFLARLAEAVRQQTEVVMKARADSDAQRRLWQGTAQRTRIIDKVVERRAAHEQRQADAREQRDTDERGQRVARGPA